MEAVFLKILNMSISACWVVLAVVLLRLLLGKAPKALRVVLWGIVGLRLVWPFSIESILSLIPSAETVPTDIGMAKVPAIESGVPVLNASINPILAENLAATPQYSANPMQILQAVAALVWVAGMAAMVLYALASWLVVRLRVREAVRDSGNIWLCDRIGSPFILGLFFPRIYLPSDMAQEDMAYVLAHEQAHLKRRDHLWKPLGFALLTLHWFNPAVWLAYILLCRDIELACDEKVMAQLGEAGKKPYSEALIRCSAPRRMITACPVAFGETGVKGRIKQVLHYKKPAFWVILVAVIACIAVAVCFLTDPKTPQEEPYDGTQPPNLQVSTLTDTVRAWTGGHYWRYVRQDGQTVNSLADANHPTAEVDRQPHLEAKPTTFSSRKGNYVGLQFELPADRVTVTAWPVDVTSSVGKIEVEATPEGFELLTGSFVYAIRGYWDDHGTAEYSFVGTYTEPVLDLTQPPTLWISDGMGQTIQATLGNWKWSETIDGKLLRDEITDVDMKDMEAQLPVMEIKPGLDSFTYDDTVLLQFTEQPNKLEITVRNYGENASLGITVKEAFNQSDDMSSVDLSSGKMTYEIHAVWLGSGEAYFYFVGDVEIPEYADLNEPLPSLQRSHSQYFGLDPKAGMKVYVWQEGFSDYRCILLQDSEGRPTDAQLLQFRSQALNMQSMRAVLYSYGVNMAEVPVVPVQMPGSAYTYALTDAYQSDLRLKLWDTTPGSWAKDPHWQIDVAASKAANGKVTVTLLNHGVNQRGVMTVESFNLVSKETGEALLTLAEKNGQVISGSGMDVQLPPGEQVRLVLDLTEKYGDVPEGKYRLLFSIWDHLEDNEANYPYDRMNCWGVSVDIIIE